jgi:hypothetical protein
MTSSKQSIKQLVFTFEYKVDIESIESISNIIETMRGEGDVRVVNVEKIEDKIIQPLSKQQSEDVLS